MSKIAKFMENELDRVNEYLSMAKASLVVTSDLCDDRCKKLTSNLDRDDERFIDYLNGELSILDAKINDAKDLISKCKNFYYDNN